MSPAVLSVLDRLPIPSWIRAVWSPAGRVRPAATPTLALRGTVWPGDHRSAWPDGIVIVRAGVITAMGPASEVVVPAGAQVHGGPEFWVGPGLFDAHVRVTPAPDWGAVVGARLLGGIPDRRHVEAGLAFSGRPLRDGPPSLALSTRAVAGQAARALADAGADLIAVAVDPPPSFRLVGLEPLRAAVEAAHAEGIPVTAFAGTGAAVERALDAGVDELARMPTEPLAIDVVARLAESGIAVVSTLQTACATGRLREVLGNASALHAAGVPLLYGSGYGEPGTIRGVDPRELDRLAEAGLGREGALRAAVDGSRRAAGTGHLGLPGPLTVGAPAAVVLLPGDPLVEPAVWRSPSVVVAPGRVVRVAAALARA